MLTAGWRRFNGVPATLRGTVGVYEIAKGRTLLKVGIANCLVKRLRQHSDSLQGRLKGPKREPWTTPSAVKSKGSILTKHLYFDTEIAPGFDLRKQEDRQHFLQQCCHVRWKAMPSRKAARELERKLEASGKYRYRGRVRER